MRCALAFAALRVPPYICFGGGSLSGRGFRRVGRGVTFPAGAEVLEEICFLEEMFLVAQLLAEQMLVFAGGLGGSAARFFGFPGGERLGENGGRRFALAFAALRVPPYMCVRGGLVLPPGRRSYMCCVVLSGADMGPGFCPGGPGAERRWFRGPGRRLSRENKSGEESRR